MEEITISRGTTRLVVQRLQLGRQTRASPEPPPLGLVVQHFLLLGSELDPCLAEGRRSNHGVVLSFHTLCLCNHLFLGMRRGRICSRLAASCSACTTALGHLCFRWSRRWLSLLSWGCVGGGVVSDLPLSMISCGFL